ncbi:MAG: DUF2752 domain-containing protein [Verrucomicrobiota bacterium]|nr:DUF2752 domain-containing protein [Verrucomicrobiota bacterium]
MTTCAQRIASLSRAELGLRAALIGGMLFGAFALRAIDPISLSWLPFRTSCGAATGLPCLFCGTTRALHHLLHGQFAEALYFNWLAFPLAAGALVLLVKTVLELAGQRIVRLPLPIVRFTPRFVAFGGASLLALWFLQVSLAVALHKRELLNPDGVLYDLFVGETVSFSTSESIPREADRFPHN